MKCPPAKALVRGRKWGRLMATRRFSLAAATRAFVDEQAK